MVANESVEKKKGLTIGVDIKHSELFKIIMNSVVCILKDNRIDNTIINEHYNSLFNIYSNLDNDPSTDIGKNIEIAISNLSILSEDNKLCGLCKKEYLLLLDLFKAIRTLIFQRDNYSFTLDNLYDAQQKLDTYIFFKNGIDIEHSKVLEDILLGMLVEVSELANTTRCFKHWSKKGADPREKQLEEYTDVLHFFLTLGNILGFSHEEVSAAYIDKYILNISRQNVNY